MEPDFSGYATRADIRCSDGRTITPDAFAHQDKIEVPLVWQHQHDSPQNVLGHAVLEHRKADHPDGAGIYCYGYFNDTENGKTTKALVHNKDVKALSIYANGLVEKAKSVLHGAIREVSVVLSGANPGAFIDNIRIAHSDDDIETLEDAAIIYTGLEIEHTGASDEEETTLSHESDDSQEVTAKDIYDEMSDEAHELVHYMIGRGVAGDTTPLDTDRRLVYDGLSEQQKEVAHYMVGTALTHSSLSGDDADQGVKHDNLQDDAGTDEGSGDDDTNTDEGDLKHQEGSDNMTKNLFDQANGTGGGSMTGDGIDTSKKLTHDQLGAIVADAQAGMGFKKAVLKHAQTYGIENIELLFPEAKTLEATPEFIARRMEWVSVVLNGTKHTPFAAVKTHFADITKEEARAKGYIKGNRKEEEVFSLLARSVRPATIIKKQKLDRDDLLDITDINVVAWLKAEMRLMIEEELARAILVGDGRPANHPDKVKDPMGAIDGIGIRSVYHDDDLFAIKRELPSNVDSKTAVREVVRAMDEYRGSGSPTMFLARSVLTDIMLEEDRFGRPLYANRSELADKLGVGQIVTVDLFSEYQGLYCIIVSLNDYNIGTNQGGELTSFEDFDIDFNQYKYLQETRLSGGLVRPFSAIVVTRQLGTLATATAPSFNGDTNVITIPNTPGVVYSIDGTPVAAGDTAPITEATEVRAEAADDHYLATGSNRTWTFQP